MMETLPVFTCSEHPHRPAVCANLVTTGGMCSSCYRDFLRTLG